MKSSYDFWDLVVLWLLPCVLTHLRNLCWGLVSLFKIFSSFALMLKGVFVFFWVFVLEMYQRFIPSPNWGICVRFEFSFYCFVLVAIIMIRHFFTSHLLILSEALIVEILDSMVLVVCCISLYHSVSIAFLYTILFLLLSELNM